MASSTRPAKLDVVATAGFADYALLDSGDGRKLERFGRFTVERPEPQALWRPVLEPGVWLRADAVFKSSNADEDGEGGRWRKNTPMPETWPVQRARHHHAVPADQLPPSRHFPRAAAALGMDAGLAARLRGEAAARAQSVRLHRGRLACWRPAPAPR